MKNFFNNLRNSFTRFMYGRYGADDFYKFLTIIFYVLFFLNLFLNNKYISIIILVLLFYTNFRVFSKNYYARRKENDAYIKIRNNVKSFFKLQKRKLTEKDYVFKKCPSCKQTLRLPRKKGKHNVVCPKCKHEFEVRI